MKRALIGLVVAAIWACTSSAQTIYNQNGRYCLPYQCTKAEFVPTATLSYAIPGFHGTGTQNFTNAQAIWNGVEYTDFTGTYTFFAVKPSWCTVGSGWACTELRGTFNGGTITVTERWEYFRTYSTVDNTFGSVVTP